MTAAHTVEELQLIEQRVSNEGPSVLVAYLLWFFLWPISAHRFYLGRAGSAVLQILSYLILIGFVWLLIDAILIPGMVRERQDEVRRRVSRQLKAVY